VQLLFSLQEKFYFQERYADSVFDHPKSLNFKKSTMMPSDIMFGANEALDLSDKESSGKYII